MAISVVKCNHHACHGAYKLRRGIQKVAATSITRIRGKIKEGMRRKMVESVKELREICQKQPIPAPAKFQRKLSIYFTKLLLHTKISANQVTLLSALSGIAAGVFFIFGYSWCMLSGALLVLLYMILDHSDGEIARYRGTASISGSYIDRLCHMIVEPYIFVTLTFGLYNILHGIEVFPFGFSAALSELMISLATFNIYACVIELKWHPVYGQHDSGTAGEAAKLGEQTPLASEPREYFRSFSPFIYDIGNILVLSVGRVWLLLLASIIDLVLHPVFTLGSFQFNCVFIWLCLYAILLPLVWIAETWIAIRTNSVENLYQRLFGGEK